VDLGEQYTFRKKSLSNSPGAEYFQRARQDAERAGMRVGCSFRFEDG
jgi:hypothetical protein